jgi:hypothetical protein
MTYPTAELPQIADLHADIVPHNYWALSTWYRANPVWQYHRRAGEAEIVARSLDAANPVDPEIRDLCALFARHGLRTTAACQGHFYPLAHFQRVWGELTWEAEFIRSVGLTVLDAGTQSSVVFRNPDYYLPWFNFDEFHRRAGEELAVGHVGILLGSTDSAELAPLLQSVACDAGALTMSFDIEAAGVLGHPVFSIVVRAADPRERARAWEQVTGRFEGLLSQHAALASETIPHGGGRPVPLYRT